jgi:hypothetical protein
MMKLMIQRFPFFKLLLSLVKEKPREFRFKTKLSDPEIVYSWWECKIIPKSMVLLQLLQNLKWRVKIILNRWVWAAWAHSPSTTQVKLIKLETYSKSLTYLASLASRRSTKQK